MNDRAWMRIWGVVRDTDAFGLVLVMLSILIWVFIPIASANNWARIPTAAVYSLSIIITIHISAVHPRVFNLVVIMSAVLTVMVTVGIIIDSRPLSAAAAIGFAVLLLVAGAVIMARVINASSIKISTISGAVAVFLLTAMAFSEVYGALELLNPGSFRDTSTAMTHESMQYFSLITISTVGYGDVIPLSHAARSLASLEAVVGQIFLVTIVARLVSAFGTTKRDGKSEETSAPDS